MTIENTRDYIPNGEYVYIKNNENEILVRFYFADFDTDEDCVKFANEIYSMLIEMQVKSK